MYEEGAIDAWRVHEFRRERHLENSQVARPADVNQSLPLAGFAEKADHLVKIQPAQRDVVDRQNLVARRKSGLRGWRSRQGLQHDHAARNDGHDTAKSLALRFLHLPELVELPRVQEDGVRI